MLKTVGFPSTRTGDQTIVSGNLVIDTAAKGIDFSANTPTAGMTSQLLDWYEEGSFTPTVAPTAGAITSYTATGKYTRTGRLIVVELRVAITNNGTGSGGLIVGGFPIAALTSRSLSGATREDGYSGTGLVASGYSTTDIYITQYDNAYPVVTGSSFTMTVSYSV